MPLRTWTPAGGGGSMTVGRKPKPTRLKLIEGNPGKRRTNHSEPKPRGGPPGCPSFLPAEAKAEWRRVVAAMPDRFITDADRAALAVYCARWAVFVAATKEIHARGRGVIVKGYRGSRVKNVALQVQREAAADVKAFAVEFGLTPSARTRIELPKPSPGDAAGIMRPTRVREPRPPGR
jgi:P27 family predicted phage terminase small subunit